MKMEEEQPVQKRRKLHLNVVDSVRLSRSEEGSASLRQPIDRSHPAARSDQAMTPRCRGRVRGPRRVSSQERAGTYPVKNCSQETFSGENADHRMANSDQRFKSYGLNGIGQGLQSVQDKPCTSDTSEEEEQEVILLDEEFSPDIVEDSNKHPSLEGHSKNNHDQREWGNEDEDRELVEQSSDRSVHLLSVFGGFKPAASLQKDSSRFQQNSASVLTSHPWNTYKGLGSKKSGKKQWVKDVNQPSITNFMSIKVPSMSSSFVSSSPAASSTAPLAASTSSDREGIESQLPSQKIVYGSPSMMYSPIKKMSDTDSVYVISDDSDPDSSQKKTSERTYAGSQLQKNNKVVQRLFKSASSSKSLTQCDTKRKESKTSTQSKSAGKGSKRKKYKDHVGSGERTLASTSSASSLAHIDFDDADDDDFVDISASVPSIKQEINVGPTFGLLNDSRVKVVKENLFKRLPQDIIENIFCSLPMTDLCLSVSLVCRDWSSIISHSQFMLWKKAYHKLKKGIEESKAHVASIMEEEGMCQESSRLLKLISFMQKLKNVSPDNNACEMLQSHPKYMWAVALLKDKAPHCIKGKEPNPWSVICALVMVSATVEDIHSALRLLTSAHSRLLSGEVLECFYCLATFLLAFRNTRPTQPPSRQIGPSILDLSESKTTCVVRGLHYRVFYALYLYENSFVTNHAMLQEAMVPCQGQQSIVKYSLGETEVRLTHEQMRIVRYTPDLKTDEIVKIFAFAGTGKTTTLLRYTQMRPHLKFLLIVFNKSVCDYARGKFPQNVTCKTGHGLAFGAGRRYAAKKKLNSGNLRVYDIAMALEKRQTNKENQFIRAKFVMQTLKNFMTSSDDFITSYHAPQEQIDDLGRRVPIEFDARMRYAEDATCYWKRMEDLNIKETRITHDGYLKLYQLSKPTLKGYDIILVDEAQDLTPAVLDIVRRQKQPKIFVGDQHQQIYTFRGAVSAMDRVDAHKIFYLTQSFRFGPEISQVANTVLETLKNESTKNIVGHAVPGKISGEQMGQLAVLCRSNFTVFAEAVKYCVYSNTSLRIAFNGGLQGFGFDMLEDIYILMLPEEDRRKGNMEIKNTFIARFRNFGDLQKYAEKTLDVELMGKIRIVHTYQHNLPQCITKIRAKAIDNRTQADVVLSTVHKAKGLEFSTVRITEDFVNLHDSLVQPAVPRRPLIQTPNEEECNLLYVAVTRAKHALIMSKTTRGILSLMGGGCYHPMLTDQLNEDGVEMKCLVSKRQFNPQTLTLYRPSVTLGTMETVPAGVLSPALLRAINSDYSCLFGVGNDRDTTDNNNFDDGPPDVDFPNIYVD